MIYYDLSFWYEGNFYIRLADENSHKYYASPELNNHNVLISLSQKDGQRPTKNFILYNSKTTSFTEDDLKEVIDNFNNMKTNYNYKMYFDKIKT